MLTKEIRKGMEVWLRNGMRARVEDNQVNQSTRLCTVFGADVGLFTEMGSVYTTDIVECQGERVTLTDKQKAQMANRSLMGF